MPSPSHVTDHVAAALARLLQQYQEPTAPGLPDLFAGALFEVQDVEDALWRVLTDRTLAAAIGRQLEQLGEIVGVPRNGLDDDRYWTRVAAEILVNRSSGDVETLIAIFKALEPDALITVTDYYPAAFTLTISGVAAAFPDDYAAILQKAKSAGVKAQLKYQTSSDTDTFTYDGTGAQAYDAGKYAA